MARLPKLSSRFPPPPAQPEISSCPTNPVLRARCAFTLIELLVVTSIIALLISILLSSLSAARNAAINTQCMNNLKQIDIAIVAYATDEGGDLPDIIRSGDGRELHHIGQLPDGYDIGKLYANNYINPPQTSYCPSAPKVVCLVTPPTVLRFS